jgi:hypothetical protein
MPTYDKWITSQSINPPIGGIYKWAAKANIKEIGTGKTNDVLVLSEHLGTTKEEAESKASSEATNWIANHS